jgi:hypothetical protein
MAAGAHIVVTRWGDDAAVLVPPDWYERAQKALGNKEEKDHD